ncbi:MAG: beta-N-acetylhexosaminidase [Christensenellaceae bacterium]|jgi:hexosaminidase|nr:beta-N-acetylhexosaminidase [Christensenellaceae bacterium]
MINLIPLPVKYEEKEGKFTASNKVIIYADTTLKTSASALLELFSKVTEINPKITDNRADANIIFKLVDNIKKEGYTIEINSENITVCASEFAGAFYAVQTLRQLFKLDYQKPCMTINCALIEDYPRYSWRGLMLDESRHFFGMETVKKLIDLLAMHKLNILHWHLSDNEGWRVEIKKYPKLTEIGSKRRGTHFLAWGRRDDAAVDWTPYSGYYTQDEIKEIVKYAQDQNVMIVPEIDMPAHFGAVLAAYPDLGCRGLQIETPIMHGGEKNGPGDLIACAGNSDTISFLYDVLDELVQLFPGGYFHIGGDEAPKAEWKACPKCQNTIKSEGLKNEEELQGYLSNKMYHWLKSKGKKLIGWNEILKATSLERDALIQYWHPIRDRRVEKWVRENGKVIISKHQAFYFDMPYAMRNLKKTYNFEPSKCKLDENYNAIIGVEAACWTEWIKDEDRLFFQLFPRIEALSETAWSPKGSRNYANFRLRLEEFVEVLEKLNIPYAPLNITDTGLIETLKTSKTFISQNAHVEYEKVKRNKQEKR